MATEVVMPKLGLTMEKGTVNRIINGSTMLLNNIEINKYIKNKPSPAIIKVCELPSMYCSALLRYAMFSVGALVAISVLM